MVPAWGAARIFHLKLCNIVFCSSVMSYYLPTWGRVMAVVYRFCPALKLLMVSVHGHTSDEAFEKLFDQVRVISSQLDVATGIFDLSDADMSEVTSERIRYLAAGPPMLSDPARRCVVTPPAYQFGMARMYQMVAKRDIDICRSLGEAYKLLDVRVPPAYQTVTLDTTGHVVMAAPRKHQKAG